MSQIEKEQWFENELSRINTLPQNLAQAIKLEVVEAARTVLLEKQSCAKSPEFKYAAGVLKDCLDTLELKKEACGNVSPEAATALKAKILLWQAEKNLAARHITFTTEAVTKGGNSKVCVCCLVLQFEGAC